MIVFDLICDRSHPFEGWFRSSSDFADQKAKGLVTCPVCATPAVEKAPMAPAVGAKGNRVSAAPGESKQLAAGPMPPKVAEAFRALAAAQAKALTQSEWVGDRFAEEVRSMHYGEKDEKQVHGQASRQEAEALLDEGIKVAPLLVPVAPPDEVN